MLPDTHLKHKCKTINKLVIILVLWWEVDWWVTNYMNS